MSPEVRDPRYPPRHVRHIRFWYHGKWYARATVGRWSKARVPVGAGATPGEALADLAASVRRLEAERMTHDEHRSDP